MPLRSLAQLCGSKVNEDWVLESKNYTPVVQEEMNETTTLILFPCWKVTCCKKKIKKNVMK